MLPVLTCRQPNFQILEKMQVLKLEIAVVLFPDFKEKMNADFLLNFQIECMF
jgi:hypothetical protein